MSLRRIFFVAGLILWCALQPIHCGIYPFHRTKVLPDQTLMMRVGMYAPEEAPETSAPGKGQSFIKTEITGQLQDGGTNQLGHVDIAVFHSDSKDSVGKKNEDGQIHLCEGDGLYYTPQPHLWVYRLSFNGTGLPHISENVEVKKSGIYYEYIVNCQSSGLGTVLLTGKTTFLNPYGYLNAELYPYLPFYGALALLYIIVGLIWLGFSVKHWRQLLKIQNWIAGVIALGMFESAVLYFDNLGYNNSGENYVAAMMVGVLFSTVKRTVSRVLVLVVSMGYGVVKPTLGGVSYKILLLAMLYLMFSGVLNIVELVQRTTVVSFAAVVFLVFPVAVLDTTFYWWIFLSLLKTIAQLTTRKQTVKLSMYKWFFGSLVASGMVSALMIIIQLFVSVSSDIDSQWQSIWVWTAFWHLLYLAILIAIAILWRPTSNNTRYAYSEVGNETEEISLEPLNLGGEVTQRAKTKEDENLESIKVVKLDESSASFSIDGDEHEPSKLD